MNRLLTATSIALLMFACTDNTDPIRRWTVADTNFVSSPGEGAFPEHRQGTHMYHELTETSRVDLIKLDIGLVGDIAFGPNQTIWIYDRKAKDGETIRILDSLGEPTGTAGRYGQGPGEYRGPIHIFQLADGSMLAKEASTTRAVRFSASGRALATIELPPVVASGWVVTPDTLGGWYIAASFEEQTAARIGRYGWLHFNSAGAIIDTVWPPKRMFEEPTPMGYAPGRVRTVDRDGAVLTTTRGPSRLLRIPSHGAPQVLEWRADPPMFGDKERQDMQTVEDWFSDKTGTPRVPLPDRKAPASRILTDGDGQIWVKLGAIADPFPDHLQRRGPGDVPPITWHDRDRWAAFNRSGEMQFVIDAPVGGSIVDRAGNRLIGIVPDSTGALSLVMWRVNLVVPRPD